jgi:hypothetical protein
MLPSRRPGARSTSAGSGRGRRRSRPGLDGGPLTDQRARGRYRARQGAPRRGCPAQAPHRTRLLRVHWPDLGQRPPQGVRSGDVSSHDRACFQASRDLGFPCVGLLIRRSRVRTPLGPRNDSEGLSLGSDVSEKGISPPIARPFAPLPWIPNVAGCDRPYDAALTTAHDDAIPNLVIERAALRRELAELFEGTDGVLRLDDERVRRNRQGKATGVRHGVAKPRARRTHELSREPEELHTDKRATPNGGCWTSFQRRRRPRRRATTGAMGPEEGKRNLAMTALTCLAAQDHADAAKILRRWRVRSSMETLNSPRFWEDLDTLASEIHELLDPSETRGMAFARALVRRLYCDARSPRSVRSGQKEAAEKQAQGVILLGHVTIHLCVCKGRLLPVSGSSTTPRVASPTCSRRRVPAPVTMQCTWG